jgi:hypothetical protein
LLQKVGCVVLRLGFKKEDDISKVPATTRGAAGKKLTADETRAALDDEHTRRVDAEERAERLTALLQAETERRSMAERQARALAAQMSALDRVVKVRRRQHPMRRLLRFGKSD